MKGRLVGEVVFEPSVELLEDILHRVGLRSQVIGKDEPVVPCPKLRRRKKVKVLVVERVGLLHFRRRQVLREVGDVLASGRLRYTSPSQSHLWLRHLTLDGPTRLIGHWLVIPSWVHLD